MELLVTAFAEVEDLVAGTDVINKLHAGIAPYSKALTAKSRQTLRAVGTSRYGLVKIVEKIANQYDGKLAKEDKASDLSTRIAYLDKIRAYKIAVLDFFEALDDTDKALGHDIMAHVDKFSSNLQTARQYDGNLDEAMKDLDAYNARFGATMVEEDENAETPTGNAPLDSPAQV